MRIFLWQRDSHPYPHPFKNGGCYCGCALCITEHGSFFRCVCPRCDQGCTGMGRLGDSDTVAAERAEGWPGKHAEIASRWHLTRRGERIWWKIRTSDRYWYWLAGFISGMGLEILIIRLTGSI